MREKFKMGMHLLCGAALLLSSVLAQAGVTIQTWQTENGTRVFFVESHAIPIVDIQVDFDAGSRRDPAGKSGLATLTNGLFARGVAKKEALPAMTESEIADGMADVGAIRSGSVELDRASVTLRTLAWQQERDKAVEVFAALVARPAFPDALFERDRARMISAIREELTQPEAIAGRAFLKALYGTHPYGASPDPGSLAHITREDVVQFHQTHYVAERAVISIVGDLKREEAEKIAVTLSRHLPRAKQALPEMPPIPVQKRQEEQIQHPAKQSHVLIGMAAVKRNDPDFFALTVGNYVLGGGGFVSRLMQEVREKRGFSYSVYSYFKPLEQKGPFQIGVQTKQAQTREAVKVVRQTLDTFLQKGITAKELQAAQSFLVQSFPLRMDNNRKILGLVSMIGYYGLPLDYLDTWIAQVRKVTTADVQHAFQRKVNAAQLTTVIVGSGE